MIAWWDALWLLAAVSSCVAVRRLVLARRRALAAAAVTFVMLTLLLAATGWSFNSSAADWLAPPVVAALAILTLGVSAVDAPPYVRPWVLGALGVGSLVVWGALQLYRGFHVAPTESGPLPDRYRYELTPSGMAFTGEGVETRVYHTPAAFPFVERAVARSSVCGPGVVPDPAGLAVQVDTVAGRRVLIVTSGGRHVDWVDY